MMREYFKIIEHCDIGDAFKLQDVIGQLAFNKQGLIPVVTQDAESHNVLMMAWMNKDALEATLLTKRVTYWSRSRKALWIKGETSGHTQALVSMHFDCDGDTVLCKVVQTGAACHTGRSDCFYLKVDPDHKQVLVSQSHH